MPTSASKTMASLDNSRSSLPKHIQRALLETASELGLPPETVIRAFEALPRVTGGPTSNCLHPQELEDPAALTEERVEHIDSCEFCSAIIEGVLPSEARIRDFTKYALEHSANPSGLVSESTRTPRWAIWVPILTVTAIAAVAIVALHPFGRQESHPVVSRDSLPTEAIVVGPLDSPGSVFYSSKPSKLLVVNRSTYEKEFDSLLSTAHSGGYSLNTSKRIIEVAALLGPQDPVVRNYDLSVAKREAIKAYLSDRSLIMPAEFSREELRTLLLQYNDGSIQPKNSQRHIELLILNDHPERALFVYKQSQMEPLAKAILDERFQTSSDN